MAIDKSRFWGGVIDLDTACNFWNDERRTRLTDKDAPFPGRAAIRAALRPLVPHLGALSRPTAVIVPDTNRWGLVRLTDPDGYAAFMRGDFGSRPSLHLCDANDHYDSLSAVFCSDVARKEKRGPSCDMSDNYTRPVYGWSLVVAENPNDLDSTGPWNRANYGFSNLRFVDRIAAFTEAHPTGSPIGFLDYPEYFLLRRMAAKGGAPIDCDRTAGLAYVDNGGIQHHFKGYAPCSSPVRTFFSFFTKGDAEHPDHKLRIRRAVKASIPR